MKTIHITTTSNKVTETTIYNDVRFTSIGKMFFEVKHDSGNRQLIRLSTIQHIKEVVN